MLDENLKEIILGLFALIGTVSGIIWQGKRTEKSVGKSLKDDMEEKALAIQNGVVKQQTEHTKWLAEELKRLEGSVKTLRDEHDECESQLRTIKREKDEMNDRIRRLEADAV